jgi:ionotropic glutamate receptor
MMEAGLDIYWKKLYGAPTGGKCGKVKQSDTGPKSLSLADLQGAFIILAIGSGIASLVFLFECLIPYCFRSLCRICFKKITTN